MKTAAIIYRLYTQCLRLYPATFKAQYGEEMLEVFADQLADAQAENTLIRLCLRELRDLPAALFNAHMHFRRKYPMQTLNRWFIHKGGSWQEILLLLLPYLLLAIFPSIFMLLPISEQLSTPVVGISVLLGIFLILATIGVIGLLVRLPRWSMPYAGMLLGFVSLVILILPSMHSGKGYIEVWWLQALVVLGWFVVFQVALITLLLWLAGKFSYTRSFYHRVKQDPTIINLAMYGGAFILVVMHFEDLPNSEWYAIFCVLPLMIAGWAFLRTEKVSAKLTWLIGGHALASLIALVANLVLWPGPTPAMFYIGDFAVERIFFYVGLSWLASVLVILAPTFLVKYLPQAQEPFPIT